MSVPLICVLGPTASGKTALVDGLSQHFPIEVISLDSAQIYRYMDIGTAKPDAAMRARIPHHLIDVLDPLESYSAQRFSDDARGLIAQIAARGKLPVIAGGTFLYLRALLDGLNRLPAADPQLRANLESQAQELGWPALHTRLAAIDPAAAMRIHANDAQRICRALEVFELSGTAQSSHHDSGAAQGWPGPVLRIAIRPERRETLRERIAARFLGMIDAGLIDEVAALRARPGMHAGLPSMRAVGYRQLWSYLAGDCDREVAIERAIIASRQYAKRQMTWLRHDPQLCWLVGEGAELMQRAVNQLTGFIEALNA